MELKRCGGFCKQEKEKSNFNKKARAKDGLQPQCRDCNKAKSKAYYAANHAKHIIAVRERKNKLKQNIKVFLYDYLMNHSCVDCPEKDPLVLEFDHVRGTKRKEISYMLRCGYPIDTIKTEIEKCEVRCANCHRRRTNIANGSFRFKFGLIEPQE